MPLTHKDALNAKPGRHSDGRGLYLLVKRPTEAAKEKGATVGSKSWVLRVQYNGERKDYGLGSFVAGAVASPVPVHLRRALTLTEARDKARIGRDLAKAGLNPSEEWSIKPAVITPTFERAAREYHLHVSKSWRGGKHGAQWLSTLETHAFPLIGSFSVDQVDASAVQSVLMPIWLTIPETARRVRQRIGVVLDYAKGKGWREAEAPMRAVNQLMRGIKQPKGSHFAAMPYGDVPAFMVGLRAAPFSIGRHALQFLILTVPRSGEVRKAKWREVDLEAAEWRQPPENTKTSKPHIIPLVPAAVQILKELVGLFAPKPDDLIFPGLKGMMSDATLAKVLRVGGGGDYTVHGFRSTFRDWAADTGFADSWCEAALAHGNPDKTEAAYRRTTFFNQRRDKLMPGWASFALADGSNVISLAAARA